MGNGNTIVADTNQWQLDVEYCRQVTDYRRTLRHAESGFNYRNSGESIRI